MAPHPDDLIERPHVPLILHSPYRLEEDTICEAECSHVVIFKICHYLLRHGLAM